MPIYIRAGSIIPCGPEIQYTSEKPADPIRIFVYTGSNGSFTFYEDENTNYNYEKGKFAKNTQHQAPTSREPPIINFQNLILL